MEAAQGIGGAIADRRTRAELDDCRMGEREGGHSENRILHYKDLTGWEIQRALNEKVKTFNNITFLEHYFALDLITQHHLGRNITRLRNDIECYGAYALNKESKV